MTGTRDWYFSRSNFDKYGAPQNLVGSPRSYSSFFFETVPLFEVALLIMVLSRRYISIPMNIARRGIQYHNILIWNLMFQEDLHKSK